MKGEDGLVRATNIRTSTGHTNRPITKLLVYPLELSANVENQDGPSSRNSTNRQATNGSNSRPGRATASEVLRRISEWARGLRAPPENVEKT